MIGSLGPLSLMFLGHATLVLEFVKYFSQLEKKVAQKSIRMVLRRAESQAPEDASMKDGIFKQYNTEAPKETQVLPLFCIKVIRNNHNPGPY